MIMGKSSSTNYSLLAYLSGNTNHHSNKNWTFSSSILHVITHYENESIVVDIAEEFLIVTLVVFDLQCTAKDFIAEFTTKKEMTAQVALTLHCREET